MKRFTRLIALCSLITTGGLAAEHLTDTPQTVVEIRQADFQDILNFNKPVIIDVYASYCTYCKKLDPIYHSLQKELGGKYLFAKLSYDNEPDLVSSFNVRSFPTLLFLKDGKVIGRHVGFANKAALKAEIEKHFGS